MLHLPAWLLQQLHRLFAPEDPAAIQAQVVIFLNPDTTLYVAADGEGAHYNEEGVPPGLPGKRFGTDCYEPTAPRPRFWLLDEPPRQNIA